MIQQYSPNMLKTYEHCPKNFYFKYIKKISMPTNDEIFEFGKNIHALAAYYLNKQNIDRMEQSLTSREFDVWNYLKGIKYFGYDLVAAEYDLAVKFENKFLGGRLDALVKKDEKYYILDYKTGSVPKDAKYDFQTMIYSLCVSEFFNTNDIMFVYIDLKNKKDVCIDINSELIEEYLKKLSSVLHKIESCDFKLIQRKKDCSCEYSIICH